MYVVPRSLEGEQDKITDNSKFGVLNVELDPLHKVRQKDSGAALGVSFSSVIIQKRYDTKNIPNDKHNQQIKFANIHPFT